MRMMSADGVEPTVVSYSSLVAVFPAAAARGDRRAPYKAIQVLANDEQQGTAAKNAMAGSFGCMFLMGFKHG